LLEESWKESLSEVHTMWKLSSMVISLTYWGALECCG
jgi:hypothetical protein